VRLSKGEEYGVRLAIRLAEAGGQLTVAELAQRERLPEPTVAKVLLALRRADVVAAERGRQGGYELSHAPEQISMKAVLRALDRPLFEGSFCRQEEVAEDACVHQGECSLLPVWQQLEQLIEGFLARLTLAEVASGMHRLGPAPAPILPLRAMRRSEPAKGDAAVVAPSPGH
jgi:Rrf2 family protein